MGVVAQWRIDAFVAQQLVAGDIVLQDLQGVGTQARQAYQLELQQEAGFQPIKVLLHATANNAQILGEGARLGRVRPGFLADLIVVNGNPLEDLKTFYPPRSDAAAGPGGGVAWTIKDGIPYDAQRLMREVKDMVARARKTASH